MLTNLTVPLLGLVDTAVLGHLDSPEYLGAVAVGANLFSILYWTFGFMRMGTTGLAAQAWGQRDSFNQVALLVRSLMLAVAIGLLLILFHRPLISVGLQLMNPSPDVAALAAEYAAIRIWSAPAVLCQYTLVGWLIGTQFPRGPMVMLIIANGINIVLDVFFVTVLGWNSRGVAMATVMAEYGATAIGVMIVLRRIPEGQQLTRELFGKLSDYLRILQVNRYIMVRTIALLLCLAFFTAQGARQGDIILAANAVLITFLLVISNALDGFANAAEALIGEAIGKGSKRQFKVVFNSALRWSLWGALLLTVTFVLGGRWLISLLTGIEEVQTTAWQYLPWLWLLPFAAVWSYLLDGVFIGPSDLSASMGYIGDAGNPVVVETINKGLNKIRDTGKYAGLLCLDPSLAETYVQQGANFVGVGVDTMILANETRKLAQRFKQGAPVEDEKPQAGY